MCIGHSEPISRILPPFLQRFRVIFDLLRVTCPTPNAAAVFVSPSKSPNWFLFSKSARRFCPSYKNTFFILGVCAGRYALGGMRWEVCAGGVCAGGVCAGRYALGGMPLGGMRWEICAGAVCAGRYALGGMRWGGMRWEVCAGRYALGGMRLGGRKFEYLNLSRGSRFLSVSCGPRGGVSKSPSSINH